MGNVSFDFSSIQPKQKEALKLSLTTPVLFYGGAKGGGKSWLVRCREIARRLKYPGTRGLIIRKSYPELRANHISMMFKEHPILRSWYNKSEKTLHYPNGSSTEFSYLSSIDDVYTYQGREYEDISVDEATQHDWEVITVLRSSNRTTNPNINPTMLLTGNPGGPGHNSVKRIFIDRDFRDNENPDDYAFVQAFVTDNTALMTADPDYVKRLQNLPEHLRKAYLDGDWTIFAGQMFSMLTHAKHVIDPIKLPIGTQYFAGYDYGYNHPFAFVVCALTPSGEYFVVSHIRERFFDVADQAKLMLKMLENKGKVIVYAGHDIFDTRQGGNRTIEDQLYDAGFAKSGHAIMRAGIDHVNGIAEMRKAFALRPDGTPNLRFFRNAQEVYDSIAEQQIDPNKPEDVIKINASDGEGGDDLYDACFPWFIKVCTLRGEVSINNITKKDVVHTSRGAKKVLHSWSTGIKKISFLITNKGRVLVATPNHPIKTQNGFVPLDSLRYGDRLETWQKSSIKTSFLEIIRTQKERNYSGITTQVATIKKEGLKVFTEKSIKTILEQYQRAITFIIKMVILATTAATTLLPSLFKNTCEFIADHWKNSENKLREYDRLQLSGTNQKRVAFGTVSTALKYIRTGYISLIFVRSVAKSIYLSTSVILASVIMRVSRDIEEILVLIIYFVLASTVGLFLRVTNTVKQRTAQEAVALCIATTLKTKVFNIEVDTNEYYANGVLVHNCRFALRSWTLPKTSQKIIKPGTGEMLLKKRLELANKDKGWR